MLLNVGVVHVKPAFVMLVVVVGETAEVVVKSGVTKAAWVSVQQVGPVRSQIASSVRTNVLQSKLVGSKGMGVPGCDCMVASAADGPGEYRIETGSWFGGVRVGAPLLWSLH